MINYQDIDGGNDFTTGFEMSINSMNVSFNEGKLNIYINREKSYNILEFPAFEFECIADDTFDKRYTVYLIQNKEDEYSVDVHSTLLYEGNIAIYPREENTIIKTLSVIKIKPNETDLNNSEIDIYNIVGEYKIN